MTHLRISDAASLLGVSDDTVRRWVDRGTLTAHADHAGRRTIDGAELARVAQDRAEAWAAPGTGGHAQSQSQSQSRGQGTGHGHSAVSARNCFRGLVTAIRSDAVMSQVEIQCGPYRVVSLISTEAVRELGLETGALATARVKATDVVLEGAQP